MLIHSHEWNFSQWSCLQYMLGMAVNFCLLDTHLWVCIMCPSYRDVRLTERQLKGVTKGRDQLLVSTLARHLPYRCSRGPGSALGEKGKKSASKASEEVVWGGERVAAFPSAQTTAGLASLADIFPF